jgi:2'-hydroxyisoflavone reductase
MTSLHLLEGRRWDAVIDTCGYEPAAVRLSAGSLASSVGLYVFISSISVYADFRRPGIDEDAPTAKLPEGASEEFNIEQYGPLKALCEQAAEQAMPGRALNIRPGLIVGEFDPTDRFTYWPWRVAQGGDVLAPSHPAYPVQFIDVRDLSGWIIRMIERGATGIVNATGPMPAASMGSLLETCASVSGSGARLRWASEAFLLENEVQPWTELPLWIPESDPESSGMQQVSIAKAVQAGLTFVDLEDTVRSTLAWANTFQPDHEWRAGLAREKEAMLLEKL